MVLFVFGQLDRQGEGRRDGNNLKTCIEIAPPSVRHDIAKQMKMILLKAILDKKGTWHV